MTGMVDLRGGYGNKEFGKSYVPGKGYISASKIPKPQLRELAHGTRRVGLLRSKAIAAKESKKWKGVNDHVAGAHAHFNDQRGFNPNRLEKKPDLGRAHHFSTTVMHDLTGTRKELLGDATALSMAHGGRRGGRMVISAKDAPEHVLRHEASHVQPKRSAYRMHSMTPIQTAREEARADMASGNPATHYKASLRSQMKGGASMYSMSAKSKIFRRLANRSQGDDPQYKAMFSNEGSKAYRDVQDRISAARSRQVKKSYLPGMGYVPANKVPKQVLRRAAKARVAEAPHANYRSDRWTRHERRLQAKQGRFESRFEPGLYPNPVRVRGKDIGGRRTTDEKYRPKPETPKSSEMRQRNRLGEGGFAEPPLGRHYHLTGNKSVRKVDTTMSDAEAHRLAQRYDTRGPLPKKMSRDQKMKAYEARYIASGGRKAEKWHRRANAAEVGRNVGLAGATGGALLTLAARNKSLGPKLRRLKVTAHRADNATIGAAAFGGASELYGEHARSRRASYQNSPGGVAGSALSRMQAYTPEKRKS